ncbi:hypothetical protein E2C01_019047 [Portunus trituberculatus]|uniref:Uncharacterized protein n=1 Tax=Portunus trituberculatus TaxID=210409 RepID=A0A5B7DY74_PORTR|nr:hypothetical protein [Portunus trituberculatus]
MNTSVPVLINFLFLRYNGKTKFHQAVRSLNTQICVHTKIINEQHSLTIRKSEELASPAATVHGEFNTKLTQDPCQHLHSPTPPTPLPTPTTSPPDTSP